MWKTVDEMEAEYSKKNEASQDRSQSDNVDNDNYQQEPKMETSQEFDDDMKKARDKFPESYSLKLIEEVMNENFPIHQESPTPNDSPFHQTTDAHPTMDVDEYQQLDQDKNHLQAKQGEAVNDFERD
ncbi:hypothetical protein ACET3Z_005027 [Daucus carota]